MTARPLVLVTDADFPLGPVDQMLDNAGLDFRLERCRDEDDVIGVVADAAALIVQWAPITAAVLEAAVNCRFISRLGIGYDMIDVAAATARGIPVANTPDYCLEEVALHSVACAFAGLRSVADLDRAVREGRWNASDAPRAVRPSETTAAVIGFGRIGSAVARTLAAAGLRVLVYDPFVDVDSIAMAGHSPTTLEEALARADLLMLHARLTEETLRLINRERLDLLPRGAYVVNTCRGGLIDEDALADMLENGQLSGAALDVFEREPLPSSSRLRHAPNVTLSPHAAWYSPHSLVELPRQATQHVIDFLADRPVRSIVNPEVLAGGRGDRQLTARVSRSVRRR